MGRRSLKQKEVYDAVWHQALELPVVDQLELYRDLREYLGGKVGQETDSDRQLRLRGQALDALKQIVDDLGIEADQLTVSRADEAWRAIGSKWRSGQVIKAWGTWNTVKSALQGRAVPLTSAQRGLVAATGGRRARTDAERLRGIQLWLKTKPKSKAVKRYREFRNEYNETLAEGERPLIAGETLMAQLGLRWAQIIAVSQGEFSLEEARRQSAPQEPKPGVNWGDLVGRAETLEILDLSKGNFEHRARRPDFPLPAAMIKRWRLWRRADIKSYAAGKRADWITEAENELQGHILDLPQLCQRLDLTGSQFRRRFEAQDWSAIPPPDGRVSTSFWWRRDRVEAWERSGRN